MLAHLSMQYTIYRLSITKVNFYNLYTIKAAFAALIISKEVIHSLFFLLKKAPYLQITSHTDPAKSVIGFSLAQILLLLSQLSFTETVQSITQLDSVMPNCYHAIQDILCSIHSL